MILEKFESDYEQRKAKAWGGKMQRNGFAVLWDGETVGVHLTNIASLDEECFTDSIKGAYNCSGVTCGKGSTVSEALFDLAEAIKKLEDDE